MGTGFLVGLGYLGHLFGHRNDWIFLGFLSLFPFLFWSTCRFTQAMECILGQGEDGTVELKINLDWTHHLLISVPLFFSKVTYSLALPQFIHRQS